MSVLSLVLERIVMDVNSVGKIAKKAVSSGSVFLTTWHCILSAELTKMHSFRLSFDDFVHWVKAGVH